MAASAMVRMTFLWSEIWSAGFPIAHSVILELVPLQHMRWWTKNVVGVPIGPKIVEA